MIIQHNVVAFNAHRQLGINNSQVKQSLEKLSSGYRVNRAADDAAGLAISEKMRAQVTGLDRAVKNALDGVSLVQTAEGAMGEVHSMLNRMQELAIQSANGTIGEDERQKIESELDALKEEIDRISQATNFNGIPLMDGSLEYEWKPVTYTYPSGDVTEMPAVPGTIDSPYASATGTGGLDSVPPEFQTQGTGPITITATPTGPPTHLTFTIADRNGGPDLEYSIEIAPLIDYSNNHTYELDLTPFGKLEVQNGPSAEDIDPAVFIRGLTNYLNGLTPGMSVDPTSTSEVRLEKVDVEGLILQVGETADDYNKIKVKIQDLSSAGLGIDGISMTSQEAAASSVDNIRDAIDKVSVNRGNMGALQNRLEHTINNLETSVENIMAAESRIRDADMAKEALDLTKHDILTQSAQSMLAQANMQPQQVLQLLQ